MNRYRLEVVCAMRLSGRIGQEQRCAKSSGCSNAEQLMQERRETPARQQSSLHGLNIPYLTDVETGAAESFDINQVAAEFKAAGDSLDYNLAQDLTRVVDAGSLDVRLSTSPLTKF